MVEHATIIYYMAKRDRDLNSHTQLTSTILCRKEKMRVTLAFLIVVATTGRQGKKGLRREQKNIYLACAMHNHHYHTSRHTVE